MFNCAGDLNDTSHSILTESAKFLARPRSILDSMAANLGLDQSKFVLPALRNSAAAVFEAASLARSDATSSTCSLDASDEHAHGSEIKKRPRSTFPFGKCKVCSDKATGVHYGIATCEGCKGFFKRSILRNEYYRCFFGNNCLITPKNRNRCKACRFKRCVQVGMSIEGIKMGRIPNAMKEKALKNLKANQTEETPDSVDHDLHARHRCQYSLNLNLFGGSGGETLSRKSKLRSNDSDDNSENEGLSEDSSERSLECPSAKKQRIEEPEDTIKPVASFWPGVSRAFSEFTNHLRVNNEKNSSTDAFKQETPKNDTFNSHSEMENRFTNYIKMIYSMSNKSNETGSKSTSTETTPSASNTLTNENRTYLMSLLRMHPAFMNSNLTARMFQSSLIFSLADGFNETTYKMMSAVLNEKIYQHMNNQLNSNREAYEKAKSLANDDEDGDENAPAVEKVWSSLIETIPSFVEKMMSFARDLQGLSELSPTDFSSIVNSRLFDYFVIINADLMQDDESYIMLANDIHYKREFMNKISGKPKVDAIFEFANAFNGLNLTPKEKALFLAIVLTIPDNSVKDSHVLKNLNEYYTKSILYEFEMSKRGENFILELSKVLKMLNECKNTGSSI